MGWLLEEDREGDCYTFPKVDEASIRHFVLESFDGVTVTRCGLADGNVDYWIQCWGEYDRRFIEYEQRPVEGEPYHFVVARERPDASIATMGIGPPEARETVQVHADEVFSAEETLAMFLGAFRGQRLPPGLRLVPGTYWTDPLWNGSYFDVDQPKLSPHEVRDPAFTIQFPAPPVREGAQARRWSTTLAGCRYAIAVVEHDSAAEAAAAQDRVMPRDLTGIGQTFQYNANRVEKARYEHGAGHHVVMSVAVGRTRIVAEVSGALAATQAGMGTAFLESLRLSGM